MNAPARIAPKPLLTRGQLQVVELAARGHEAAAIGRRLGIGAKAVETALQGARRRLCARNTAHLCALAIATGLIEAQVLLRDHAATHRAGLAGGAVYLG